MVRTFVGVTPEPLPATTFTFSRTTNWTNASRRSPPYVNSRGHAHPLLLRGPPSIQELIGAHAVAACGIIVVSIFTAAATTVQIAGIGGDGDGGGSEPKGVYSINKDVERARRNELWRLGSNRTEPRTQSQHHHTAARR